MKKIIIYILCGILTLGIITAYELGDYVSQETIDSIDMSTFNLHTNYMGMTKVGYPWHTLRFTWSAWGLHQFKDKIIGGTPNGTYQIILKTASVRIYRDYAIQCKNTYGRPLCISDYLLPFIAEEKAEKLLSHRINLANYQTPEIFGIEENDFGDV